MIRRPPRSTLFPTRRSSDLVVLDGILRGDDEKRLRKRKRFAVDGDLRFVHGLEKRGLRVRSGDRKSTRLNSSHGYISYAVFCLKKKNTLRTSHALMFGLDIT